MQSLADFFEKETNKKINISKYNNQQLKSNENLVIFNGETYVFELSDKINLENLNGHYYLIYQPNLDFENLKGVLYNLYENVEIFEYSKYLIINSKNILNIDFSTPEIIESETYRKTYIAYLGNITDMSIFKFRLSIIDEIISNLKNENNFNNFITLNDLSMYKVISLIKEDKSIYNLIDFKNINSMDKNLLDTGLSFIDNDLNISKTSTSLFLHRNTLIYRLEKIKEILGLDLKVFKDAFIFYLCIKSYLISNK